MRILTLNDTHKGMSTNTDKIHRKFFTKLESEEFDMILHAGDMIGNKQAGVKATFKQMRNLAGDRPIGVVRGNHDYWQHDIPRKTVQFMTLLDRQREWADEFDILLLDEGSWYETEQVFISGFPTWYQQVNPPTNDYKWFPRTKIESTFSWLRWNEQERLRQLAGRLLERPTQTRIVLAHMPIFGEVWDQKYSSAFSNQEILAGLCEHYVCGHSHRLYEGECAGEEWFGAKVHQTGSDYDKPKFRIIEV